MTIEIQFRSVTIQPAEMQENPPEIFSVLQPYLPSRKSPKRRKPRNKRETVSQLIDALIDSIDNGSGS